MARLLALEWGQREARVAVARTRGSDVVVEHAFAVNLTAPTTEQPPSDETIAQLLAEALNARGLTKLETLVAVGRASIELRQLSLPPAPPEELPDLVRFQALREFTTIGEDWPIDFVPTHASDAETTSVLAVAISPEMVSQIKSTCQTVASSTPKRLVLRPFAAASLLRRYDQGTQQPCRLMVDLLADEADLTVLLNDAVVLMRTVRLAVATDGSVNSKVLVGEIRRTIASAQNQLRGPRVEKVILCGDGNDQTALKNEIETGLSLAVELFDPFVNLELDADLQNHRPDQAGRFAPLLGMLLDEAADAAHPIDFLHPRKRPEPPSQTARKAIIGGAIAATLLLLAGGIYWQLSSLDADLAVAQAESDSLKELVDKANVNIAHAQAVQRFVDSDITWLDEMYNLAKQLPPPEDAIFTQLQMSTRQPSGAQIVLDGYTREADKLSELQEALRVQNRSIISTGTSDDARRDEYNWRFKETVILDKTIQLDQPESTASSATEHTATESAPTADTASSDQETSAQ